MSVKRAILFVDVMNVYKSAREAFFSHSDPHPHGQFDPVKLGALVIQRTPVGWDDRNSRQLIGVRTYQGSPAQSQDKKGYSADRRHRAAWERRGITVVSRPLTYRYGEPTREKGIDVALAVDFVTMAVDGKYDLGILASADTDLLPAIEYVVGMGLHVETVAWWMNPMRGLTLPDGRVWCHRLGQDAYRQVEDSTDYNVEQRR